MYQRVYSSMSKRDCFGKAFYYISKLLGSNAKPVCQFLTSVGWYLVFKHISQIKLQCVLVSR